MAQNVTIYSTDTCTYCTMAKQFLKEHNIAYEDVDLGQNPDRIQEVVDKSGQRGVPVIEVDGEIIVGFDKHKLEKVLGL